MSDSSNFYGEDDSEIELEEYGYDEEDPNESESKALSETSEEELPWIYRKIKLLQECVRIPNLTQKDMEWPYYSSEEEMDRRIEVQSRLKPKVTEKTIQEDWKKQKEIIHLLRPTRTVRKYPLGDLIVESEVDEFDTETHKRPRYRSPTTDEIFMKLPLYFKENPMFTDLDTKYNTGWFRIRETPDELREKAGIKQSALAHSFASLFEKTLTQKEIRLKMTEPNPELYEESEDSGTGLLMNSESRMEKKSKIEIEENMDSKGGSQGNPDIEDDNMAIKRVLDERDKAEILKNASIYHQEIGLKTIKGYFNKWKRKIEKINERNFLNVKKNEELKSKDMVEKSLIQREKVQSVKKTKIKSKDLYYKEDADDYKLSHALPTKLNKFIKNCNDIYKVDSKPVKARKK